MSVGLRATMIISFAWPSTALFGGGVAAMFDYANALARRGHEIHLIHGPKTSDRIDNLDQLDWFSFEESIEHHIVDSFDEATLPGGDICFPIGLPPRLGLPAVFIQGYKMVPAAMERHGFRAACPKICVASWLIDIGVAWGSPAEQLLHVPLGIDHDVFHVRTPIGERTVDVAMLHSTHPIKGALEGMAGLEEVYRRRPGLRVELFSIPQPDRPLPSWATHHHAPNRLELAETVYSRAKVFVQPSRREGFGLTALEAMACGCALVTTDNGGSRDYAFHDETALVVPVGDPIALADAIEALLDDDERRTRLAAAGERHSRRFHWDRSGELLETHLERYLADPGHYQHPPSDAPMFLDDSW